MKDTLPANLLRAVVRVGAAKDAQQLAAVELGTVPFVPGTDLPGRFRKLNVLRLPGLAFVGREHEERLAGAPLRGVGADDTRGEQAAIRKSANAGDAVAKIAQVILNGPARLGRNNW